jgi:toxin ParE1/3/4
MNYSVEYSEKAKRDIEGIFLYIALTLKMPETAKKQFNHIVGVISGLNTFPLRNPLYEHEPWKSKGLRFVPVDNFIVFYLPNESEKTVYIVRVMYGGRDIQHELETL